MVEELMLALRVGREKLPRLDGMTETAQTTASKHFLRTSLVGKLVMRVVKAHREH